MSELDQFTFENHNINNLINDEEIIEESKEISLDQFLNDSLMEDELMETEKNHQNKLEEVILELFFIREENEKLKIKISDYSGENMKKNQEIDYFEEHNKKLEEKIEDLTEIYENQIKYYKEELEKKTLELQGIRKREINLSTEKFFDQNFKIMKEENFELKNNISVLEINILNSKTEWAELNNFLSNELQLTEKLAVDAKLKLAEVSMERDYLQNKIQKLSSNMNNTNNINTSNMNNNNNTLMKKSPTKLLLNKKKNALLK